MKKRLIAVSLMLALSVQSAVMAATEIPGGILDRAFDTNRTLYYVEFNGENIPDIEFEGYSTVSKANEFYSGIGALTSKNTTVIKNDETGKRYRFVFTKNSGTVEVKDANVSNAGVLTVNGEITGNSKLKIFILRPTGEFSDTSYSWESIDKDEMEKTVLDVVELSSEDVSDGVILKYTFPKSAISGTYGILITGDAVVNSYYNPELSYTAQEDLDRMMREVNEICKKEKNSENAKALQALLEKYNKYLYLDMNYYNQLSGDAKVKACTYMFKDTDYEDIASVGEAMCCAVAAAWANDSKSISQILTDYNEYLNLDLYEDFTKLNKTELVASKTKTADSVEAFKDMFNKATAWQMLTEAKDPEAFGNIMETKKNYLDITESKYTKYLENKDTYVRSMYGKTYTSGKDIDDAIDKAGESGNGNGNNGGTSKPSNGNSGGGSKNTSSGFSMPVLNPEKEPDSEIKESGRFPFTDCSNYEWAENAIEHMYNNKIISGKSETEFCPQDNITREEFVKIIVNAFGFTDSAATEFTDVSADAWYKESIDIANAAGIINGISETEFGVGRLITREDMAVIIQRSINKAGLELDIEIDTTAQLSDTDTISDYALSSVEFLVSKGAIKGYDGKFNPKAYATRAEAAQMIYQIIKIR